MHLQQPFVGNGNIADGADAGGVFRQDAQPQANGGSRLTLRQFFRHIAQRPARLFPAFPFGSLRIKRQYQVAGVQRQWVGRNQFSQDFALACIGKIAGRSPALRGIPFQPASQLQRGRPRWSRDS